MRHAYGLTIVQALNVVAQRVVGANMRLYTPAGIADVHTSWDAASFALSPVA